MKHLFTALVCLLLLPVFAKAEEQQAFTVDCKFPSGNIIVDSIKGNTVRVHQDLRDTKGNWFFWAFRVKGAENRKLNFVFTKGGVIGARGPAISGDGGVTWKWLSDKPGFPGDKFEYQFGPNDKEMIFAFSMLYSQASFERFLKANESKFKLTKSVLCKSKKGRDVELLRFGNPTNPHKLAALITCRHHACEMMASYVIEGVIEEIFSDSEEGKWLRENVDFYCVPFIDKDGVEDGDQGKNRKPHDHNRDYAQKVHPEIKALTKLIPDWAKGRRVLFHDFHCPWMRFGINEVLYYPGIKEAYQDNQLKRFATILEKKQKTAAIPFFEKNNLPFGKDWNIGTGQKDHMMFRSWSATFPQALFGATIEVPYANASGAEVNVTTARELGHNVAKTMREFLQQEVDHPTVNTTVSEPATPFNPEGKYLNVSGVYPHLTAYNQVSTEKGTPSKHGEAGIGALVPWAGKLWYLTYPQHQVRGSNDKLYSVDENLHLTVEPQSLGGTHANRMIHRESNQLFMGYYAIDAQGKIRTFDPQKLVGRMTATMRHLTDPKNKIYFYDMEGAIYEADVKSLAVKLLFKKPFPGWHGKGAYTGQNRVVFANNGATIGQPLSPHLLVGGAPKGPEDAGILAQWDGKDKFEILLERQFTDVTGPGGIYGAKSQDDPIWTMGWDKRSVMLKLLEGGQWYTYRVPKASYTFDPKHGWFTEWPRIRETFPNQLMMCMHATLFNFPKTFCRDHSAGLEPIASHLRYIPDFCAWKDKIVLASDEASMQENERCGQAQSNLWFGTLDQIRRFGPRLGWGGLWINDQVKANEPGNPFLFKGYEKRVLHLKGQAGNSFKIEFDVKGDNTWTTFKTVSVGPDGYSSYIFDKNDTAQWVRLVPQQDGIASAFFHYLTPRANKPEELKEFDSLANISGDQKNFVGGLIRPATEDRSLQWLMKRTYNDKGEIFKMDLRSDASGFEFQAGRLADEAEVRKLCGRGNVAGVVDASSVIVTDVNKNRFRLPKGPKEFDQCILRDIREVESERYLAQFHGTFYEIPRLGIRAVPDYRRMKPVASHAKRIDDFCTWRGMLVLAGTNAGAKEDGHFFANEKGKGLWFGQIDDLWKIGSPKGEGGPLLKTAIKADTPSDPYLMTGYDQKKVTFSHDLKETVVFTIEVDFDTTGFSKYTTVTVPAGQKVEFQFPDGYQAHWLRVSANKACKATAWCVWK